MKASKSQGQPGTRPAGPSSSARPAADTDAEPVVKSKSPRGPAAARPGAPAAAGPAAPSIADLIPIDPSTGRTAKPGAKVDPYTFYSDYYRSTDKDRTDPERLRKTVTDLNRLGRRREVHAALRGYLQNQPKSVEPWMYEALAGAIELNQGSKADVKKSLDFAADLAQRSHNPNHLVSAADQLIFRGYVDRVGALLDEAMPQVPHRSEPIVMSINLAQKTRDAKRMADSVENLLSLGWPGQDEYFRLESANQVDTLAKGLREDGKGQEADALLARLTESQARDLYVRLSWDGDADYDLSVLEPLGATACFMTPRTVFGGSIIKNGYGSHPEEIYVCPRGFDGDYTVTVSMIYASPSKPVSRLTLETIVHEGTAGERKETHELSPDRSNKPVVLHLTGGRRKKVLPFVDPAAELMKAAAATLSRTRPPGDAKAGAGQGKGASTPKTAPRAKDAGAPKPATAGQQ